MTLYPCAPDKWLCVELRYWPYNVPLPEGWKIAAKLPAPHCFYSYLIMREVAE